MDEQSFDAWADSQILADPVAEARRLIEEVVHSHAHKNERGGYFTDPHTYNECDESECLWCYWAKALLARTSPPSASGESK